jgi:hypothetical protein
VAALGVGLQGVFTLSAAIGPECFVHWAGAAIFAGVRAMRACVRAAVAAAADWAQPAACARRAGAGAQGAQTHATLALQLYDSALLAAGPAHATGIGHRHVRAALRWRKGCLGASAAAAPVVLIARAPAGSAAPPPHPPSPEHHRSALSATTCGHLHMHAPVHRARARLCCAVLGAR